MARGKYVSDFEKDVMRIGVVRGKNITEIADYLGRTKMCVSIHVRKMRAAGTLENLPFGFLADDIAGDIEDGKQ